MWKLGSMDMKRLASLSLALLLALGLSVLWGTAVVAKHETKKLKVTFSSSPRFPVVGQEARLTITVTSAETGEPLEGQTVVLSLEEVVAEGGHAHGGPSEEKGKEEAGPLLLQATDMGGGIYILKHAFAEGGRFNAIVQIGELGEVEFPLALRGSPVAWGLLWAIGLLTLGTMMLVGMTKAFGRGQ